MASVSVGIWVAVGGRYEPAALTNAACRHFIEHLLFKGTAATHRAEIRRQSRASAATQRLHHGGAHLAFTPRRGTLISTALGSVAGDMFIEFRL